MQCLRCYSDLVTGAPRCPICGNKVGEGGTTRIGTETPKTGQPGKKGTASLPPERTSTSGKLAPAPEAGGFLGEKIDNLPIPDQIKKAKVSNGIALWLIVALIGGIGFYYAQLSFRICLTCPKIEGKYEGTTQVGNEKPIISLTFIQQGSDVIGSVKVEFKEGERAGRTVSIPVRVKDLSSKVLQLETIGSSANKCTFNGEIGGDGIKGKMTLSLNETTIQGTQFDYQGKRLY